MKQWIAINTLIAQTLDAGVEHGKFSGSIQQSSLAAQTLDAARR